MASLAAVNTSKMTGNRGVSYTEQDALIKMAIKGLSPFAEGYAETGYTIEGLSKDVLAVNH